MLWKRIDKSFVLLSVTFGAIVTATSAVSHKEKFYENVFYKNIIAEIQVITYTWTIENFNLNDYADRETLKSCEFGAETNDKYKWHLSLYPKGQVSNIRNEVSMFIVIVPPSNISANIHFGIMNNDNELIISKKLFNSFEHNGQIAKDNIGYDEFVKRDFLTNKTNRLLVNNTLKIFCKVETIVSTSQDPNKKFENDLGKDLAFLLDNELFSDIKISTNGKDFPAHKIILAARCPFFKAVFEHDTQVKNTSRVDMTDMDQAVVKEMLRYIYTNGEVSNLEDLSPNLLIAAEKCEWVNLKATCENSISSRLSIENAVEYYKLGDAYFAEHLKNKAKDYIVAHASDIVSTNEFKSLILTHPLLVEEKLSSLIKKLSTN